MDDLYPLLQRFGPWIGGAVGGALVSILGFVLKNRRPLLTYNVTHSRIGMSADDAVHGKVELLYRGNPVQNLYYLSVMEIRNRSIRDLENLNIKTLRGSEAMAMLTEEAHIPGTLERVDLTKQYFDQVVANAEWEKEVFASGTAEQPEN